MVHDYSDIHMSGRTSDLTFSHKPGGRGETFFTDLPISFQQHTLTVMHESHPIPLERDII